MALVLILIHTQIIWTKTEIRDGLLSYQIKTAATLQSMRTLISIRMVPGIRVQA